MRDFLPPSVRDVASLRLRDPGSMLRDGSLFSRSPEAEGQKVPRGRELPHIPGTIPPSSEVPSSGRASRDEAPVSSTQPDSGPPPSRRRDSLPPLRPISIAPVRGSVAPGRISVVPGRMSAAPTRAPAHEEPSRLLLVVSGLALFAVSAVMAVVLTAGPLHVDRSTFETRIDWLWTSNADKQVTGYGALAFALASLFPSLITRYKRYSWSEKPIFRVIHGALGVATLLALILHTGLHLGMNLNRMLMYNFLSLTLLGAGAGGILALTTQRTAAGQRAISRLAHSMLFWPLPVLLALHILAAYYY
jgi:hypothetical protein